VLTVWLLALVVRFIVKARALNTGIAKEGDLWFDTSNGNRAYYFNSSTNQWVVTDDTRIAATAAGLVTEQTARTTADSALSSQITTLTSTVNGHSTSIQTLASTTDGLSAQYAIKVDNNGYISGFGLASTSANGTPTSAFVIQADTFSLYKAGAASPIAPFTIDLTTTPCTYEVQRCVDRR